MTAIIYFVTPQSLVKIGTRATKKNVEFIPILGPNVNYTKKAKKITQMSNPISVSSLGIGMLFNYCFGKAGATSIECTL